MYKCKGNDHSIFFFSFQKLILLKNKKGKWIEYPPETIESNTRGIWTIQAPGDFDATHGNCTYQYANSNGTWVAFFYWHWSPYGGLLPFSLSLSPLSLSSLSLSLSFGQF